MKKAISLLLVLVLALGMSTVAFATNKAKKGEFNYDYLTPAAGNSITSDEDEVVGSALSDIFFNIDINGFNPDKNAFDGTDVASAGGTLVSKGFITKNDIGVKLKWKKGSQLLDEAKIDGTQVKVAFNDFIATTGDIDYEFTVLLVVNGATASEKNKANTDANGTVVTYTGTYKNSESADWDDNWYDFDGKDFVKMDTFIRNMEFGFSDEVTVHGRALKGVKYYGYATDDVSSADEELMVEHAAIAGVYHLYEKNVKSVADYVTLNDADASMYIYTIDNGSNYVGDVLAATGTSLRYLGRGNEKLEYADVYYLATAELDTDEVEPVDDEEEDIYEDEEEDDYVPAAGTGGDDNYPENPHDNPGTGK